MDVEAKIAFASRNIEIEAAIAEVQVPRWAEGIVDGPEHLPIRMRADPETANIAIGSEPEAIAKLAVITPADKRVGPAAGAVHRAPLKQPRVQGQVRGEPPGAKSEPAIGKLHRVLEKAVEGDPGARIRLQRGVAALKRCRAS